MSKTNGRTIVDEWERGALSTDDDFALMEAHAADLAARIDVAIAEAFLNDSAVNSGRG